MLMQILSQSPLSILVCVAYNSKIFLLFSFIFEFVRFWDGVGVVWLGKRKSLAMSALWLCDAFKMLRTAEITAAMSMEFLGLGRND